MQPKRLPEPAGRAVRWVAVLLAAVTACVVAVLLGGGSTGATASSVPRPPASRLTPVAHAAVDFPPYRLPVVDPVFGSTVVRVSDQRAFGSDSLFLRHSHAKVQPWNADGSRLLLGYTDPGFVLDGRTYAFRGGTVPRASVGVWSNVDPDLFYAVDRNRLLRLHVPSGRWEVVHTAHGWDTLSIGDGEGSPANDDSAVALVARGAGREGIVVVDLRDDTEVATLQLPPGSAGRLDWAAVSQSGQFVVLNWLDDGPRRDTGVDLYDRQLRFVRHLHDTSERADLGRDAQGQDVYVTFDPPLGKRLGDQQALVAVPLGADEARVVLRTDWVGTHVSCRNTDRPGWCYVSDSAVDAPQARTGGYDEVYAVRLDGSQTVERFAHAHQSRGVPYDWTTLAAPSRDGSRVVWASDWGGGRAAPAYAYVASFDGPAPTQED